MAEFVILKKHLQKSEATWELEIAINERFLEFHLEDKMIALAESSDTKQPLTYKRRRKSGPINQDDSNSKKG